MKKSLLSVVVLLNLAAPAIAQVSWTHGSGSGFQFEGGIDLGPNGSISYHCSLSHGVSILVPGKQNAGKANILIDGKLLGPMTLKPYDYSDSSIFDLEFPSTQTGEGRAIYNELIGVMAAGSTLTVQRPDGTVLAEFPLKGSSRISICKIP